MTDPGIAVFDTDHFSMVCGDDAEFQREVIDDFLTQFDTRLADIAAAASAKDPAAVHLAAHALKGAAASLGAAALAEATARMEALGRARDLEGAPQALRAVLDEAERLREAIARYLRAA